MKGGGVGGWRRCGWREAVKVEGGNAVKGGSAGGGRKCGWMEAVSGKWRPAILIYKLCFRDRIVMFCWGASGLTHKNPQGLQKALLLSRALRVCLLAELPNLRGACLKSRLYQER